MYISLVIFRIISYLSKESNIKMQSAMSTITTAISKYAITKCIELISKNLFIQEDPIWKELNRNINIHQHMIEGIYISSIKSCHDYISLGDYHSAANALMNLSNMDGTATINYLLAMILCKIGKKELGSKKMEVALQMNPLLATNMGFKVTDIYEPIINAEYWDTTPFLIDDTFGNKVLRKLGFEINEGVYHLELSTLGGNIAYLIRTKDTEINSYGVLNVKNGYPIWSKTEKSEYSLHLRLSTPQYTIFEDYNGMLRIFNAHNGYEVAQFTKATFEVLFGSSNGEDYYLSTYIEQYSHSTTLPIVIPNLGRKLEIIPIQAIRHKYWKTDGNHPHPGIDFDPVIYYAMNVKFKLR